MGALLEVGVAANLPALLTILLKRLHMLILNLNLVLKSALYSELGVHMDLI